MTVLPSRFIALAILLVFAAGARADVRTLNLDFGNAGAYVGGGGVLSSPGGAHWNEITVTSFPPSSGIGIQFHVPILLDEFGQSFNLPDLFPGYSFPDLSHNFQQGYETTSLGLGPLNDGVHLEASLLGFLIRELSTTTPIDLVVYFNNPNPLQPEQSTIHVNPFGGGAFPASTTGPPTGLFPGLEGRDYLRFTGLTAYPTTIGEPPLPGINIAVVPGVANIAAIQIRGEFVRTPEPGVMAMVAVAAISVCALRRFRRR